MVEPDVAGEYQHFKTQLRGRVVRGKTMRAHQTVGLRTNFMGPPSIQQPPPGAHVLPLPSIALGDAREALGATPQARSMLKSKHAFSKSTTYLNASALHRRQAAQAASNNKLTQRSARPSTSPGRNSMLGASLNSTWSGLNLADTLDAEDGLVGSVNFTPQRGWHRVGTEAGPAVAQSLQVADRVRRTAVNRRAVEVPDKLRISGTLFVAPNQEGGGRWANRPGTAGSPRKSPTKEAFGEDGSPLQAAAPGSPVVSPSKQGKAPAPGSPVEGRGEVGLDDLPV